jgi:hypothetical protein
VTVAGAQPDAPHDEPSTTDGPAAPEPVVPAQHTRGLLDPPPTPAERGWMDEEPQRGDGPDED